MSMSKSVTKSFNHSVYALMKNQPKRLSFSQRHTMTSRMTTTGKDLHHLGYGLRNIQKIKQKHIQALIAHWQAKKLSVGTIKNRLSDLQFACEQAGRATVMTEELTKTVGHRDYAATHDRSVVMKDVSAVSDQHLQHSLRLQREFGLRREECIKIIPSLADKGDSLWLKGSWTKGKVQRWVPITNKAQRLALDQAVAFAGEGHSLIPQSLTYIEQRHRYQEAAQAMGLNKLHGLRHAYAQQRYKTLTKFDSPIKGGKPREKLTAEERAIDYKARCAISLELGHSRLSVTRLYLG